MRTTASGREFTAEFLQKTWRRGRALTTEKMAVVYGKGLGEMFPSTDASSGVDNLPAAETASFIFRTIQH